jgi:hypothetical protein
MTLSATESSSKGEFSPMAIAAIVVNAIANCLTAIDTVLAAEKCSNKCSMCAKQYIELSNEMSADIDTISLQLARLGDVDLLDCSDKSEHPTEYDGRDVLSEYKYIKAKYLSKQQSILNEEPNTLFFRSKFIEKQLLDTTSEQNVDELDEVALINLRQRVRRGSKWKVQRRSNRVNPIAPDTLPI